MCVRERECGERESVCGGGGGRGAARLEVCVTRCCSTPNPLHTPG